MPGFGHDGGIRGIVGVGNIRIVRFLRPVIDKSTDLHPLGKRRGSADVVFVVMSDQDIINLLQACHFDSSRYTVGIAAVEARETGIHQQRLTRWIHNERGLPAFDIN